MRGQISPEQTTLQTLNGILSLRQPVRDISLTDFDWVAQKSIFANPVLVARSYPGAEEPAAGSAWGPGLCLESKTQPNRAHHR